MIVDPLEESSSGSGFGPSIWAGAIVRGMPTRRRQWVTPTHTSADPVPRVASRTGTMSQKIHRHCGVEDHREEDAGGDALDDAPDEDDRAPRESACRDPLDQEDEEWQDDADRQDVAGRHPLHDGGGDVEDVHERCNLLGREVRQDEVADGRDGVGDVVGEAPQDGGDRRPGQAEPPPRCSGRSGRSPRGPGDRAPIHGRG